MIPDETVERVRESADIVAVIGEHVQLKRVGNSFRGPCPFHQGKDPNFSVSPKGGYTCFVCHEKGDVFTFVQKRLGLDFVEVLPSLDVHNLTSRLAVRLILNLIGALAHTGQVG